MVKLAVTLLGTFQLRAGDSLVEGFDSGKTRALLAYLLVEHDVEQPREKLAALLWPDQDDRGGRHSLSQALSTIRRVLGPSHAHLLEATRNGVKFALDESVRLDTYVLEQAVDQATTHAHNSLASCPACLSLLENTTAQYGGDFLRTLPAEYSDTLETWVLWKRAQLERRYLTALHHLAESEIERGEFAMARRYARRQLAVDSLHEEAQRQLMRAYAFDGRRAAALRHYREFVALLRDELGVDSSVQSQALYEAIRDRSLEQPGRPTAPSTTRSEDGAHETMPRVTFVARERELATLIAAQAKSAAGHGRIFFVAGETGSGKTALLQELAWQIGHEEPQAIILTASGNAQTGQSDPYLLFRDLLYQLIGDDSTASSGPVVPDKRRQMDDLLNLVGQALLNEGPELINSLVSGATLLERGNRLAHYTAESWASGQGGWLGQLEALLSRQGEATALDQSRLIEQVQAVLRRVASERPLLILLDDLQWADAGSIALLVQLGRHLRQSRILVVGAYRAEDIAWEREGKRHSLAPVVNEFKRAYGDICISLDVPAAASGRSFVDAFLDSRPNQLQEPFRRSLYEQTGGHPLFVIELLRDLTARGVLAPDEAGVWREAGPIQWRALPARVEGTVAERIGRLSPSLQELLTIAAVEGETFTAQVIAHVQSADEREVVRRLSQELNKQHHLVVPVGRRQVDGQRLSLYRFRHAVFQTFLYEQLDESERSYLHEDVGHVLESLYGTQTADIAVQLARHFEQAGDAGRAITYLLDAGDRAMRLSAYVDAAAIFRQALDVLRDMPVGQQRAAAELRLQIALGLTLSATEGFAAPQVERCYARARALANQIGNEPDLFPTMWGLFYYYLVRAEDRAMRDLAEQLRRMAADVEDPVLRPVGHWALGVTKLYAGELDAALENLNEMIAYYDPQQSRPAIFRYATDPGVACRFWSAWALWLLGYPDQAADRCFEALALAQRLDHPFSLAFALFTSAALYQFRAEPRETQQRAEATRRLATDFGFGFFATLGSFFEAWAISATGDLDAGIQQMQKDISAFQTSGSRVGLPHMLALLADAQGQKGETTEGQTVIAEALAAAGDSGERHYEAELHRLRGDLHNAAGDSGAAETSYLRAIQLARHQRARMWELRANVSLARLWQSQGRHKEAAVRLAEIYGWFTEGFDTPDLLAARHLLAELQEKRVPGVS